MAKNKSKKDARRDAAQDHIARMNAVFTRETELAIASAKFYEDGWANRNKSFEPRFDSTEVVVVDSDSVSAALDEVSPVALLDFASYHNPGGGYENGAWAQEEALCSESNLWNVLDAFRDSYYEPHSRSHNSGLYTSDAVYLSDIRFVRNGVVKPADVIVVAAPNAGAARKKGVSKADVERAMRGRIDAVMAIAADNGVENLVLGAFGCGVFANDPTVVAGMFKDWLNGNSGVFKRVVFAIPGKSPNLDAFSAVLG